MTLAEGGEQETDQTGREIKIRSYPSNYSGVCIVLLNSILTYKNPAIIGKYIHKNYRDVNIISSNPRKLRVETGNPFTANKIALDSNIRESYNTIIPRDLVEVQGLVHIHTDVTSDYFLRAAISYNKISYQIGAKITDFVRFSRNADGIRIPLWTCLVSFSGNKIPEYIALEGVLYPVKAYIPKVRQCFKCWKYGHTLQACRSATCCRFCAEDHSSETCEAQNLLCRNCSGKHSADDKSCQKFINIKSVFETKAKSTYIQKEQIQTVQNTFKFCPIDFPALHRKDQKEEVNITAQPARKRRRVAVENPIFGDDNIPNTTETPNKPALIKEACNITEPRCDPDKEVISTRIPETETVVTGRIYKNNQ